ncbi:hypothetical protein CGLO_16301 [Colletotrichum gloeosporioides Cg-14]|uniref:Uncharacterized protein n=1 Tax=Colletotrichum gloeosporioides (strain Cg-14) TaxID=1237896 RepID=T0JNY0_COLGC|nr:hypothetical protein CGLO_16301 [Colletotrichum gloeosporioides Cg-14]
MSTLVIPVGTVSSPIATIAVSTVPRPPFPSVNATSAITLGNATATTSGAGVTADPILTGTSSTANSTRPPPSSPPFPSVNSSQPANTIITISGTGTTVISTLTAGTSSTNPTISPSLPPFPVTNSTLYPSTLGSITGTITGTGGTPIPTLTGGTSAGSGTITGLPTPTTEPPFPTRNGTSTAGPTGTAPPEGSGTIFFTTEAPETSSGLNATATTPPFPAGNVTVIPASTGNSRPPHHANPYSLAVCNIDAAVPNFKRNHRAYCHRGWSSTWNCDSERALQPVAELNILVAAIFIVVVFASVPSYWAFNYPCHCHQLNGTGGIFHAMPYGHCNQWDKSSTGATNRTSSNTATTLLTSTTKASVSVEGDSTTMLEPDGPVVPTTTVSDFTLPSNEAYPWGGNGPLFRRPNTTATDSEEVPVRQPDGWWLRWKRHFDRSRPRAKESEADVTHET